jgi:HemK-like putative methylase
MNDSAWLLRDKYDGATTPEYFADVQRLDAGEPLAYVIGWIPFLGTHIYLDSKPLIPRPETEWWTEKIIKGVSPDTPVRILDLFAGSGCIGVALLKHIPHAHVTFGELEQNHTHLIEKNIVENGIDQSRAVITTTDIFSNISDTFDLIVANPPYIPFTQRTSAAHEITFEPSGALYADQDGLALIYRFLTNAPHHLNLGGTVYMEFNSGQEDAILKHCETVPLSACVERDQYGRMRLLVAQYTK